MLKKGVRMKILGISAGRPMGNSEILLKNALKGAEAKGAEVEFIRLQDFQILPCKGCELCVRMKVIEGKDSVCSIPATTDQHVKYEELVLGADGIVLAAPCYNLTVAGRLLDALNRNHKILSQIKRICAEKTKYAATIGIGGSDWTNYLMPILNFAATEHCASQMRLVDQMLVENTPANQAVVLNEEALARAYKLGENLAEAVEKDPGADCYAGDMEEVCPICHNNHLELRNGKWVCPTCNTHARVTEEDGKVKIEWLEGYDQCRWSEYGEKLHLDCIRNGHALLMENKDKVDELTKELKTYLTPIKP